MRRMEGRVKRGREGTKCKVGRRTVMGRREDLAATGAKRATTVRSRRQQAAGDRRGDRWDGRDGGWEDMAVDPVCRVGLM
jgi:hypothetical protein